MPGFIRNARTITCLIFLLGIVINPLSAIILDIQQVYQNQTNWCWCACSKAILDYYGYVYTQEQIAQFGTDGQNITNWLWGSSVNPTRNGVELILRHFGNQYTVPYISPVPQAEANAYLTAHQPFIVNWAWNSGGAHVLVAKGISENTMYLMDPWYGPTINSYDWTVSGGGHTWSYSLAMVNPTPLATASAPSPANQSAEIAVDTNLSWTNPPNATHIELKLGTTSQPDQVIYSGAPIQSINNLQLGGQLRPHTSYYWQIKVSLPTEMVASPVWQFTTQNTDTGFQIGTGSIQNTQSTYPSPYGNMYSGVRHQFLVKASELQAAGMNSAGLIESAGFKLTDAQAVPLTYFAMGIKNTAVNSLSGWIDNLQTVSGSGTYFSRNGWNIHPFHEPFYWDGISNLVIETIFMNTGVGVNSRAYQSSTPGFNSTLCFYTNDLIFGNNGISATYQQRPNILLKFATQLQPLSFVQLSEDGNTINLSWSAVYGATSYKIFRSNNPYPASWGSPYATVGGCSFTDSAAQRSFYRIIANRD